MMKLDFEYRFYKKNVPFLSRLYGFILTMFGAGLTPKAPGTMGSAVGLMLWYLFSLQRQEVLVQIFAVLALFVLAMLCGWGMVKAMNVQTSKDDQRIVIDEAVGIWISLIAMPEKWWVALLAFGLFRLFDIYKLYPCDWIDKKMKNFWGVMLDDVVAGVYAHAVLYVILGAIKWM